MLNHKQQAKMAVLKHLSTMMDGMMGSKVKGAKKPVAAHMEVDVLPKHAADPMAEASGPADEMKSLEHSSEPSHEAMGDADLDMLRHHYGSLK